MGMPGWALGLGAAMKAPEVVDNYMGLFKNVQSIRDSNNATDEMKRLESLSSSGDANGALTDQYYSPATRQTLEKLRADKLQSLLKSEAAVNLGKISAMRNDPRFQDPEVLKEVYKDPSQAIFGQGSPAISGYVPAIKGSKDVVGSPAVAAPGANPYVMEGLQSFQTDVENRLNRFSASKGDRWAGSGLDKEQSLAFKNVSEGQKDYAGMDEKAAAVIAENALNGVVSDYPLAKNVESWNGLGEKLRKVPNLDPKLIDSTLTAIAARNNGPVGAPLTQFIKNGPNSTKSAVNVDMFGEPVVNTRISSTNNPSDREQGLVPDRTTGTGKQKAPVFYLVTKPDGRLVQVDGNTPEGQARLASARKDGEVISKLGTNSVSQTTVNADGSTSNQRVSGPTTTAPAAPAKTTQAPAPETSMSKSGKPMIKVNGVWEYK